MPIVKSILTSLEYGLVSSECIANKTSSQGCAHTYPSIILKAMSRDAIRLHFQLFRSWTNQKYDIDSKPCHLSQNRRSEKAKSSDRHAHRPYESPAAVQSFSTRVSLVMSVKFMSQWAQRHISTNKVYIPFNQYHRCLFVMLSALSVTKSSIFYLCVSLHGRMIMVPISSKTMCIKYLEEIPYVSPNQDKSPSCSWSRN